MIKKTKSGRINVTPRILRSKTKAHHDADIKIEEEV